MRAHVFNAGVLVGVLATSAGAWAVFGGGIALLVGGAMVWTSTMAAALLARSLGA
jgi:divalent metal cation (Fe/Co/Zn/Cd) transporter